MEWILELVSPALGIVLGYLLRGPQAKELVERVRVEYVDRPVVVETLKVERVEVPVIVERPTIERVTVDRIVEKPVVQIERVEVPVLAGAAPERGADSPSRPLTGATARLHFMDAHERKTIQTETVAAGARRPQVIRNGQKFACARQAENGEWIYRLLPRERAS